MTRPRKRAKPGPRPRPASEILDPPIGVRLGKPITVALRAAARSQDRTVQWCARKAIEEWLERGGV